jgi:hypothetical protein
MDLAGSRALIDCLAGDLFSCRAIVAGKSNLCRIFVLGYPYPRPAVNMAEAPIGSTAQSRKSEAVRGNDVARKASLRRQGSI